MKAKQARSLLEMGFLFARLDKFGRVKIVVKFMHLRGSAKTRIAVLKPEIFFEF